MDRLSESIRVAPANRAEEIDFTRAQTTRAERRDDVEARADQRVNDRDRTEHAREKPEGFAQHLEEQKSAHEPRASVESSDETPEQQVREPRTEQTGAESESQPVPTPETPVQPAGEAFELQAAPLVEGIVPDALVAPSITAPTNPLPVPTGVAQQPSVLKPAEIQPAIAAAPRLVAEKPVVEVESSANIGAPRTEIGTHQAQAPSHNRESAAPALELEAPRETPAARSAHEVERAADILRQIRVQLTPELNAARIQLQPIELGRVSIQLTLEEGRMKTVVRAEKAETLQAIQTHLPELRASLRQHGIDAQEFQLLLGFEQRERRDGDDAPRQSHTRTLAAEATAIERSPALHAAVSQTGVDIYA